MTRLLRLFMIFALVVTQGSAMAQAVCRHESAKAHMLARESSDARVAAVSLREEAAAAASSKKAAQSADASAHWPAQMLPAEADAPPPRAIEPVRLRPAPAATLASTTIPPLLKPPSA